MALDGYRIERKKFLSIGNGGHSLDKFITVFILFLFHSFLISFFKFNFAVFNFFQIVHHKSTMCNVQCMIPNSDS